MDKKGRTGAKRKKASSQCLRTNTAAVGEEEKSGKGIENIEGKEQRDEKTPTSTSKNSGGRSRRGTGGCIMCNNLDSCIIRRIRRREKKGQKQSRKETQNEG